jgi:tetratricopeptide (TPR) repeat protein
MRTHPWDPVPVAGRPTRGEALRALAWVAAAVLVLLAAAWPARAADPLQASLEAARRASDDAALAAVQQRLHQRALERTESFEAQIAAAEAYLARADRLRNERKLAALPDDVAHAHREQQAAWADAAMPFARRAEALAADDAQRAQAERVLGELHAHKITGMLSGMWNGPRARGHLERALELAPDDPRSRRAIGLMYLFNPPISGGDVPRAIETFQGCAADLPEDDRCPVLLGMAFRKHGEPARAAEAAREALRRNPESRDARLLLEAVADQEGGGASDASETSDRSDPD